MPDRCVGLAARPGLNPGALACLMVARKVMRKRRHAQHKEKSMSNHVYKHLELTGSSTESSDDAVRRAIAKAAETVRNIQWFEVTQTRGHVHDGKVQHWQVTLKVGFTLE
jgi:flavin-binding protein dodecin